MDRPELVYSKGSGVPAFTHIEDALLGISPERPFPASLWSKLVASPRAAHFAPKDQAVLKTSLGYYSDLQSLNSEDSVTWATFGTLLLCDPNLKLLVGSEAQIILFVTLPPDVTRYEILSRRFSRESLERLTPSENTMKLARGHGATVLWASWVDVLDFLHRNGHPFGDVVYNYLAFGLGDYRERYGVVERSVD